MFEPAMPRPGTAVRNRNRRPGSAHYRRRLPSAALRENAALLRDAPVEHVLQGTQNSVVGCCTGCQLLLTATVCGPSRGILSTCSTVVFRFMLRDAAQVHATSGAVPFLMPGRVAPSTATKSARQVAKRLCQEFKESGLTAPDRAAELSLPQLALFQDVLARCADEWSVRLRFCDSLDEEKDSWQEHDGPEQLYTVHLRELDLLPTRSVAPTQGSDATDDLPGRPPEETMSMAQQSELSNRLSAMEDDLYSARCEAKGLLSALESLRPLLQELKRAIAQEERCLQSRERTLKQQFVTLIKAAVERERALAELYADSQCWANTPLADIIRNKGAVGHAAADNAAAAQLVDIVGRDDFSILDVSDMASSSEAKQKSTRNCQHLLAKALSILRRTLSENVKPSPESTVVPKSDACPADFRETAVMWHARQDQGIPAPAGQGRPAATYERSSSVLGHASHHHQDLQWQERPAVMLERPGSVLSMNSHHAKESNKVGGQENLSLPRVVPAAKAADDRPAPPSQDKESEQLTVAHRNLEHVARLLKRVLGGAESEALSEAKAWVSTSEKVAAIRENLLSTISNSQKAQIAAAVANCQQMAAEMASPEQQKCVFHTIHSDSEEEDDVEIPSDIASIPTELGSSPGSQQSSNSGCRDVLEVQAQPQLQNERLTAVPPSTPKPPAGHAMPTRIFSDGGVHVRPGGCVAQSPTKGVAKSNTEFRSALQNTSQRYRMPNAPSQRPRTPRLSEEPPFGAPGHE